MMVLLLPIFGLLIFQFIGVLFISIFIVRANSISQEIGLYLTRELQKEMVNKGYTRSSIDQIQRFEMMNGIIMHRKKEFEQVVAKMIRYHGGSYGSFSVTEDGRIRVVSQFRIVLGLGMDFVVSGRYIAPTIEELMSEQRVQIPFGGILAW